MLEEIAVERGELWYVIEISLFLVFFVPENLKVFVPRCHAFSQLLEKLADYRSIVFVGPYPLVRDSLVKKTFALRVQKVLSNLKNLFLLNFSFLHSFFVNGSLAQLLRFRCLFLSFLCVQRLVNVVIEQILFFDDITSWVNYNITMCVAPWDDLALVRTRFNAWPNLLSRQEGTLFLIRCIRVLDDLILVG